MARGESEDRPRFLTQLSRQNTCQFAQRLTKLSHSRTLLKHILYCRHICRLALCVETLLPRTVAVKGAALFCLISSLLSSDHLFLMVR